MSALDLVLKSQLSPTDSGASAGASGAIRTVEFDASDYTFNAPETVPPGLTTIRLTNRGQEPHHGHLPRLNEGITFDDFTAALQQEG